MGWGNVPDDWGCYFTKCSRCGTRYHASEGGCGCLEDLEPCQCGECRWDGEENPRCNSCGTGPHEDSRSHYKEHRARKAYLEGRPGEIRPGDLYRRSVHFGYYPGGAFTLGVSRRRLEKGPAWGEKAA